MIDIPDARHKIREHVIPYEVGPLLDELEAARQRISELESRLETNDKLSSVDIYD